MGKKRTFYKKQQVPFFISKLLSILNNQSLKQIISWSESGNEFVIHKQSQLVKEILPQYFKHHNLASFIRQLNLYGFHKMENISQYSHEHFKRQSPHQLKLIKRIVKQKKKKKQIVKQKRKQKQLQKQFVKNCQQLQKLALENEKLKQQNKKLIKNKKQREQILKKLKAFTKTSQKKLKTFYCQQQNNGQATPQNQQNPSTYSLQQAQIANNKNKAIKMQRPNNEQQQDSQGQQQESQCQSQSQSQKSPPQGPQHKHETQQSSNNKMNMQMNMEVQMDMSQNSMQAICSRNQQELEDQIMRGYFM